jgi:isopentenyl-diphosphate delta-isomerase
MLILVDENDHILGYESKEKCHQGDGILHRAFSIFIFNGKKELLVQQRSAKKPLWPEFWSNSVCSHPRKGENDLQAARRRLIEEIGVDTPVDYLFKFHYRARYKNIGSENESCSVFIGKSDAAVSVDPEEIAAYKYMNVTGLDREMKDRPFLFTPWFKIEWQTIKKDYFQVVENL